MAVGPRSVAHPKDGILLDGQGQVRPALERPIAGTFDLDGKEAFLLLGNHKLTVTRGGVNNIVWERSDVEYVREVLPAKSGEPTTVVVPSGESFLGLDGATGKPLCAARFVTRNRSCRLKTWDSRRGSSARPTDRRSVGGPWPPRPMEICAGGRHAVQGRVGGG